MSFPVKWKIGFLVAIFVSKCAHGTGFLNEHQEPAFEPSEQLMEMTKREWIELTEEVFQTIFRRSAVKRTKFNGLRRNIDFLQRE